MASSASPTTLAVDVGDPVSILGLWVGFGLVSLCGALAIAELCSMLPHTGGVYVYLRAAYGDAAAFVFGWLYLLVATPAAIGALAVFFAELLLASLGVTRGRPRPGCLAGIAGRDHPRRDDRQRPRDPAGLRRPDHS